MILEDEEMPEEERREYLQIISEESHRLARLANNVLALNRVESQSILTDAAPFALAEQLRQCALMLEQKWADKSIDLCLDLEECTYTGSEALLKEVWLNLLDNAVKFSPAGATVELSLHKQDETIVVAVKDYGPGMDAATKDHMFDQFYQGDTSHKSEGNGLGLTMASKIIALHQGEIEVESALGQGCAVIVQLPVSLKK